MKEYIFAVNEKTPDAIGLSVGQIRRHCKELIRCKDCKYWGADGYNNECEYMAHTVFENDYCSNAERKEE